MAPVTFLLQSYQQASVALARHTGSIHTISSTRDEDTERSACVAAPPDTLPDNMGRMRRGSQVVARPPTDTTRAPPLPHRAAGHPEGGQQNPEAKIRDPLRRKSGPPRLSPRGREAIILIMPDRNTRRPRGFGLVELPNGAEAQAAIAGLNGTSFGGRPLTVTAARQRDKGVDRGTRGGKGARPAQPRTWQGRPNPGPRIADFGTVYTVLYEGAIWPVDAKPCLPSTSRWRNA